MLVEVICPGDQTDPECPVLYGKNFRASKRHLSVDLVHHVLYSSSVASYDGVYQTELSSMDLGLDRQGSQEKLYSR